MKNRWIVGFLIVALGLLFGAYWLGQQNPDSIKPPKLIDAHTPPTLSVENPVHDLGELIIEEPAEDSYTLTNTGGETLIIENVETSCGCTVAELDTTRLNPGESTKLNISLDTSIKLGEVTKTIDVYSNDPVNPKTELLLKAVVKLPKGQEGMAGSFEVSDPLVLFKGECKTCHVDRGVGKTGQQLFIADCGMCHGPDGQGGVSPPLIELDYSEPAVRDYVRKIIANGSPNSPTMPPYSKAKGGPLSESQIDSLVKFLAYQHKQYKAGKLKIEPRDTKNHAHTMQ